jgi:subtilisin family serine protease
VQALRAAGIVPVFASGNSGPDPSSVLAPGSYAESFTVGSTDFFDDISFFSSQGPSPCDGATKPNISAPGEFILSTFPGADYLYLDGTSMATPHVSGAAAVLLSIDPTLTVEEVEAALVVGSLDLGTPGADNEFGAGRLDLFESRSSCWASTRWA